MKFSTLSASALFVGALATLGAGCSALNQSAPPPAAPSTSQAPVSQPVVTAPTSVLGIQLATALDKKGNIVKTATSLSQTDKKFYVVVGVQSPQKNDTVSIIRYYKGKYLKANTVRIKSAKVKNTVFKFSKKKGVYPKGDYKVKVFYNKKYSGSLQYSVK